MDDDEQEDGEQDTKQEEEKVEKKMPHMLIGEKPELPIAKEVKNTEKVQIAFL